MQYRRFSAFFLVGFFVVLSAILLSSKPALSDWTNDLEPPSGTVRIQCGNSTPVSVAASGTTQINCSAPDQYKVIAGCLDGLSGCSRLKYSINDPAATFVSEILEDCTSAVPSSEALASSSQKITTGAQSVYLKDVYDCAGNHILSTAEFKFVFCQGNCGPTPTLTPTIDTPTPTPTSTPVTNTPTATPTNPVVTLPPNWFQGVGGDMRQDWAYGFTDNIPTPPPALHASILRLPSSQSPGVVYSIGSTNPPTLVPSVKNWLVTNSPYAMTLGKKTSYAYLNNLLLNTNGMPSTSITNGGNCKNSTGCDIGSLFTATIHVYTATATAPIYINALTASNIPSGSYVILADNNITIVGDIALSPGVFLLIASKKNIIVNGDVIRMVGFYSADENFTVNPSTNTPAPQLTIEGFVAVNAERAPGQNYSFSNQRQLVTATTPSVLIIERPDLILSTPEYLRRPNYIWQEVAP